MGAMTWKWLAPYGSDAEDVLDQARLQAFASRAYGKPYARGEPATATIEELIEAFPEDGTCSVIDVSGIGDAPGPACAGPFPADVLKDALGSVRPTRTEAEAGLSKLYTHLERGDAAYVVCFEKGRPSHVLFLGYSFD